MTARPPFHYETAADIVRICGYGLQKLSGITDAQYAVALADVKPAPAAVAEYRAVESDGSYYECVEAREWQQAQDEYQTMIKE